MFFEPYVPSATRPWTRDQVSHLARRACFQASGEQLARWHGMGPVDAASHITGFPDGDPALEKLRRLRSGALLDFAADSEIQRMEQVRADWIFRMVHGSHGLQQRLVLFWHDHFAVQASRLTYSKLVTGYLDTLRNVAGQPFPAILTAVAQDPSMLKYLDNAISTGDAPNENWARELMELYSLGLDEYTQRDVVELARIFTGWTTAGHDRYRFAYEPERHDPGDKRFLGQTIRGRSGPEGMQEGLDAIRIITQQPACARHLAKRLLTTFADPSPEPDAVEAFAKILQGNGLDVRAALATLFASEWFYAPERVNQLVRSPAVWVVSLARGLDIRNPDLAQAHQACRRMGMDLMEPPSVGGWDHSQDWFSPMAAEGRMDWAQRVAALPHSPHPVHGAAALDFDALWNGGDGRALIQNLLAKLGLWQLMPGALDALYGRWLQLLDSSDESGWPAPMRRKAARMALLMVVSLPENCLA